MLQYICAWILPWYSMAPPSFPETAALPDVLAPGIRLGTLPCFYRAAAAEDSAHAIISRETVRARSAPFPI